MLCGFGSARADTAWLLWGTSWVAGVKDRPQLLSPHESKAECDTARDNTYRSMAMTSGPEVKPTDQSGLPYRILNLPVPQYRKYPQIHKFQYWPRWCDAAGMTV